MKDKKNIDRLFQEKFKDFEVHPDEKVWQNILERKEEKKLRIIPLWIKLSGAAALLLLLFTISNNLFLKPNNNQNPIVETTSEKAIELNNNNTNFEEETKPRTASTTDQTTPLNKATSIKDNTNNQNLESTVAATPIKERKAGSRAENSNINQQAVSNTNNNTNTIAEHKAINDKTEGQDIAPIITPPSETSINSTEVSEKNTKKEISEKEEKPSILEAIVENTEEKSQLKKEEAPKKWGVTPMVAPVYYNSFSGSGIDPLFDDNEKHGKLNLSYGVQISYAISPKLTIRSGINKVDLNYITNDIAFNPAINAKSIRSINYKDGLAGIEINDAQAAIRSEALLSTENQEVNETTVSIASVNQKLGYLEIPIEMQYALLDKKLGIQFIGGISTLFLDANSISLIEGDMVTELGSSNSLNSTSLSTNLGFGFDYKITKTITFDLEPIFKYQLNAYNKSVQDFKPYYLGVYTGLRLNF